VAVETARPLALPTRLAWISTHRELLWSLLRREVRQRYKGSALGIFWSYLHPLLMAGIYTLVFSVLWRATTIPHYALFVLTGLAVFSYFQSGVLSGTTSIVDNADLVKKIWFPREIIVMSSVLSHVLAAAVMFAIVIPVAMVIEPATAETFWLLAPTFVLLVALTAGLAMMFAAVNVYFRDVSHLLGVLFLPWYFLTPVLYTFAQLPGAASHPTLVTALRYGNPVTPYVEVIRDAVLLGRFPSGIELTYVLLVGPAFFVLGLVLFQRRADSFAIEL
jgi:ABC-2 type transport system permease protein